VSTSAFRSRRFCNSVIPSLSSPRATGLASKSERRIWQKPPSFYWGCNMCHERSTCLSIVWPLTCIWIWKCSVYLKSRTHIMDG
jgi:hypothetical protein